jgi:hypothetical protein
MKKKSTSQSAFFNVRVLIGLFVFLAGVFLALVVRANPPVIEYFPSPERPGPPFYANFAADFIPTDDGTVGIAFIREPSCIPTDFNLLLFFDVPAAFGCELTIEGKLWWYDSETDPFPFKIQQWGLGAVPIYFVDEAELAAATQDGVLTIGELQALPSLLIGLADSYLEVIHNSNQGGAGKGHSVPECERNHPAEWPSVLLPLHRGIPSRHRRTHITCSDRHRVKCHAPLCPKPLS